MARLDELRENLKRGQVYRRSDLAKWSKSVDRHLGLLVKNGTLEKLSTGLYYYPKATVFGNSPPEEEKLIRSFLKDDRFLMTSPNAYNSLGVGTTQLYNKRTIYNHKRDGEFKLGNRVFNFHLKHHFPKKSSLEFLLVDLVNNLEQLAEDHNDVLDKVFTKVSKMDSRKLKSYVMQYGNSKTKKLLEPLVNKTEIA